MKKTVNLFRVSPGCSRDIPHSLQNQDCLDDAFTLADVLVVGIFQEDGAGVSLRRPGLDTLWQAISKKPIDLVWTSGIDRISRQPEILATWLEEYRSAGIKVLSSSKEGNSSMGFTLMEVIGEQGRSTLVGRLKVGREMARQRRVMTNG